MKHTIHKNHPIRIGFDFDGVVAYNPLRIIRAPITFIKRRILKKHHTEFYIPTSPLMKFLFWLPHQWSFFPGKGMGYLKQLVQEGKVEAYIVSGRYGYLDAQIPTWLNQRGLQDVFTAVYANEQNEQPPLFKERMLKKLQLDYFIEDNLDIVEYLVMRTKTRIYWIYNIFDRKHLFNHKYASPKEALMYIIGNITS